MPKTCFIITPIGPEGSDIRREADGVIDAVIEPVLAGKGIEMEVAHRITKSGSITTQVIQHVIESDLVVANLTSLNPNVMYELAIRHAVRKPLVQMCEKDTVLPFDINEQRTIFYSNDMKGAVELKSSLEGMINSALEDEKPDNPIYKAVQDMIVLESDEITEPDKYMLKRIEGIERTLNKMTKIIAHNYNESEHIMPKMKMAALLSEKEIKSIEKVIKEYIYKKGGEFSTAEIIEHLRQLGLNTDGKYFSDTISQMVMDEVQKK